jgi:hypothetical protein
MVVVLPLGALEALDPPRPPRAEAFALINPLN